MIQEKIFFNPMGLLRNPVSERVLQKTPLQAAGSVLGDSLSHINPMMESTVSAAANGASIMAGASRNGFLRATGTPMKDTINRGLEGAYNRGHLGMDKSGRFQVGKLKDYQI